MNATERREAALALLSPSEATREACENAVIDADLDIWMTEAERARTTLPVELERTLAAQLVKAINKIESAGFDFGSRMSNLAAKAGPIKAEADEIATSKARRPGNVDSSRKRNAVAHAIRLLERFPPPKRVSGIVKGKLAAILIGEPEADMKPYVTDTQKRENHR